MSEISIEVAGVHRASHLLYELRCELERERAKLNEVITLDDDHTCPNNTHTIDVSGEHNKTTKNPDKKEIELCCTNATYINREEEQQKCECDSENAAKEACAIDKAEAAEITHSEIERELNTLRHAGEYSEEQCQQLTAQLPLSLAEISRVAAVVNVSSSSEEVISNNNNNNNDDDDVEHKAYQEIKGAKEHTASSSKGMMRVVSEEEQKAASMVQKSRFAQREYELILQMLRKQRKERDMLSSYELFERNAYADLWALGLEKICDEAKEHRKESALLVRERIAHAYWHKRIRQRRDELEQKVNNFANEGVLHDDDLLRLLDMKMSFEYWTSQLASFEQNKSSKNLSAMETESASNVQLPLSVKNPHINNTLEKVNRQMFSEKHSDLL